MWRIPLAAALVGLLFVCTARAQEEVRDSPEGPAAAAAEGDVEVDPRTGERFRWVRPSEEIRRGELRVPGWVAISGGVLVALAAAGVLAWRVRGKRR